MTPNKKKKTKNINKLSRLRRTDWKSALRYLVRTIKGNLNDPIIDESVLSCYHCHKKFNKELGITKIILIILFD